jgi:hypothetical protein
MNSSLLKSRQHNAYRFKNLAVANLASFEKLTAKLKAFVHQMARNLLISCKINGTVKKNEYLPGSLLPHAYQTIVQYLNRIIFSCLRPFKVNQTYIRRAMHCSWLFLFHFLLSINDVRL